MLWYPRPNKKGHLYGGLFYLVLSLGIWTYEKVGLTTSERQTEYAGAQRAWAPVQLECNESNPRAPSGWGVSLLTPCPEDRDALAVFVVKMRGKTPPLTPQAWGEASQGGCAQTPSASLGMTVKKSARDDNKIKKTLEGLAEDEKYDGRRR